MRKNTQKYAHKMHTLHLKEKDVRNLKAKKPVFAKFKREIQERNKKQSFSKTFTILRKSLIRLINCVHFFCQKLNIFFLLVNIM